MENVNLHIIFFKRCNSKIHFKTNCGSWKWHITVRGQMVPSSPSSILNWTSDSMKIFNLLTLPSGLSTPFKIFILTSTNRHFIKIISKYNLQNFLKTHLQFTFNGGKKLSKRTFFLKFRLELLTSKLWLNWKIFETRTT